MFFPVTFFHLASVNWIVDHTYLHFGRNPLILLCQRFPSINVLRQIFWSANSHPRKRRISTMALIFVRYSFFCIFSFFFFFVYKSRTYRLDLYIYIHIFFLMNNYLLRLHHLHFTPSSFCIVPDTVMDIFVFSLKIIRFHYCNKHNWNVVTTVAQT